MVGGDEWLVVMSGGGGLTIIICVMQENVVDREKDTYRRLDSFQECGV